MRVLLVDGDHAEGDVVAGELREGGHEVVRCFGPDDTQLCRGVALRQECPVDSGAVEVAVLVRSGDDAPLLREMGAVCALRHRLPVVEAHDRAEAPFSGWVTPTGDDIATAVEVAATGQLAGHVAAVEAVLVDVPAVVRHGAIPAVAVSRQAGRLLLTLTVPAVMSEADRTSITTWAVRALRDYDPYEPVCDVVVAEAAD